MADFLRRFRDRTQREQPSTSEVSPVASEEATLTGNSWERMIVGSYGYTREDAEKLAIRRVSIRRVMDQSGWDDYKSFCIMLTIAKDKGIGFPEIAASRAWQEYKDLQARALIDSSVREPEIDTSISKKDFFRCFYTGKQKQALRRLRNGEYTLSSLVDYLQLELPEEFLDTYGNNTGDEADTEPVIIDRLYTQLGVMVHNSIFICVPQKYAVEETILRKSPVLMIGYPQYAEVAGRAGVPFAERKALNSYVLDIAAIWKDLADVKTIAITGSIGKTSTTEMINCVVGDAYKVHRTEGNQNTTWQITNTVFRMKSDAEVFIQECSGSTPGQLEKTSRAIRPDIFVLTNIGEGHIGNYDGRQERLLYEKLSIERNASENAVGIINYDDALLRNVKYHHEIRTFSLENKQADYHAENIISKEGSIEFDIIEKNGFSIHVVINATGRHNIYNALAAYASGRELGIQPDRICDSLEKYSSHGARQNIKFLGGRKLYIDCLSATEQSVETALATVLDITVPENNKKIMMLADLSFLGDQSQEIHRRIGRKAAESGCADIYFFYGLEMHAAYEEALSLGANCRWTESRSEIDSWLVNDTRDGDLIAIKAGHASGCLTMLDDLYGTTFYIYDKYAADEPVITLNGRQYKCINGYGAALLSDRSDASETSHVPAEIKGIAIRAVGDNSYSGSDIAKIEFQSPLKSIGNRAFSDCTSLKSITLPDTLVYIGENAFKGCTHLDEIDLSRGCVTIDKGAFNGCTSLAKVILPGNLRTIAENAFDEDLQAVFSCPKGSYAESWVKEHGFMIEH